MMYRNLFLTMLLGGLWHGAAWTYVLWGVYHGLLLIAYHAVAPYLGEKPKPAQQTADIGRVSDPIRFDSKTLLIGAQHLVAGIIMFHLTCLGWLLFRAQNVTTVTIFLQSLFTHPNWSPEVTRLGISLLSCSWFLIVFQVIQGWCGTTEPMTKLHWFARLNIWLFVIMSLLTLSAEGENSFIYFAF